MRYNPWIEVNRAGQAARRKAYSGDRLLAPINRQFIALQAFNASSATPLSYRVGSQGFFVQLQRQRQADAHESQTVDAARHDQANDLWPILIQPLTESRWTPSPSPAITSISSMDRPTSFAPIIGCRR
ncbi:hypothetical protein [Novosphingobium sp. Fuku2-ISO-50]|uniref:hypothetical protein n=1 Tax=Novosphingobium sp. Fuku2-ISO-50 TaxID=1739114 RepID=UPI0012E381C9|nr:hypothetical protein [Novosphingobium sp. Fuku2-ISO-50]